MAQEEIISRGKVYLIPNTLGGESTKDIIPQEVADLAVSLRHFAVEDIKSARRLLRKMDREFPIDESQFFEINWYKSKSLSRILQRKMESSIST